MHSSVYYCNLGESMDAACERLFGRAYRVDHTDTRTELHEHYIQHPVYGVLYGVYML